MSMMTPITLRNNGTGIPLYCTDSSGATRVQLVGDGDSLVVCNTGTSDAFLAYGGPTGFTAVAPVSPASTVSFTILARTQQDQLVIDLTVPHTHVAGVCKTGETTTLTVHLVQR